MNLIFLKMVTNRLIFLIIDSSRTTGKEKHVVAKGKKMNYQQKKNAFNQGGKKDKVNKIDSSEAEEKDRKSVV